jgi:hypothetical protein
MTQISKFPASGQRHQATDPLSIESPFVISEDDARGASAPEEGTLGDTLLPMLITLIVCTALGVSIVAYFVMAR